MTNLLPRGSLVLPALVLVLLSGCSDDDDETPAGARETPGTAETTEAAEAVDVVASAISASPHADFRSESEARCVARGVVDGLGVERLQELGLDLARQQGPELTVPPMTADEGDVVYATYDECLDFAARDVERFVANGLTDAEARCAHERYRGSPLPQTHLLLQDHDQVSHPELHAQVETLWDDAQAACRGVVDS